MKTYFKPTISFIIIGVFWILAIATIRPPQENKSKNCEFLIPAVSKQHKIIIEVYDRQSKLPIINAQSSWIYDKYDKVQEDTICKFKDTRTVRGFNISDENGIINFETSNLFYSTEDYLVFYVDIKKEGYYSVSDFKNLYYDQNSITIKKYLLKRNDQP